MPSAHKQISHPRSILEAEATALLSGMHMAFEAGFKKLEAETDCLQLVNEVTNGKTNLQTGVLIVEDIRAFSSFFQSFSLHHVSRACNRVEHELAQLARHL